MNWLDWLIIAVLAFSAFHGLRCGLVSSVARLAGILLGFGVGITYYRDLAVYLNKQWNIEDKITPLTGKILKLFFPVKLTSAPAFHTGGTVTPGEVAAGQLNPYSLLNPYGEYLARSFTAVALNAICFLGLILITVWAVRLAGHVFSRLADISFLGPLNRIGGIFFGGARGIIVVMVFLTLMAPFQQPDLVPENRIGTPGAVLPGGVGVFSKSKILPCFVPLFNAIDRPLPGVAPLKKDQDNPVQSV